MCGISCSLTRARRRFGRGAGLTAFDLDIEPQQRAENKGAGNLRFLPGLVDAYGAVLALARPADLTVNADIQNKLLKGTLKERRSLLASLPRLTLMLYELSSPGDGQSTEQRMEKLRTESGKYLAMAYDGLGDGNWPRWPSGCARRITAISFRRCSSRWTRRMGETRIIWGGRGILITMWLGRGERSYPARLRGTRFSARVRLRLVAHPPFRDEAAERWDTRLRSHLFT